MTKLDQMVAVITGGGRALGKCIALELAKCGARVALLGPDDDELRQACEEIAVTQQDTIVRRTDIRYETQVSQAFAFVQAHFGRVDLLVNNAGIAGPTATIDAIEKEDWDDVLAINLTGAYLCSKAVLPAMRARGSGRIVNISSIAGTQAYPLRTPYAASKWGLVGLTLSLAKEVGPDNIQVNAICPGPIAGPRIQSVFEHRARELGVETADIEREYVDKSALGRLVQQQDIANMVAFLASQGGENITGQAIEISAGYGL